MAHVGGVFAVVEEATTNRMVEVLPILDHALQL